MEQRITLPCSWLQFLCCFLIGIVQYILFVHQQQPCIVCICVVLQCEVCGFLPFLLMQKGFFLEISAFLNKLHFVAFVLRALTDLSYLSRIHCIELEVCYLSLSTLQMSSTKSRQRSCLELMKSLYIDICGTTLWSFTNICGTTLCCII